MSPGRPRAWARPLWPEDETADLRDLGSLLDFRFARALRRWKGEEVTLSEVIHEMVMAAYAQGRLG